MFECFKLKILSKMYNQPILNQQSIEKIISSHQYIFFINQFIIAIPFNSPFYHPAGIIPLQKNHLKNCYNDFNYHSQKAKKEWFQFCVGLAHKKDLEKYIKN